MIVRDFFVVTFQLRSGQFNHKKHKEKNAPRTQRNNYLALDQ